MTNVPKITESGEISLHMPIMCLSQKQKHEEKMLKLRRSVEYCGIQVGGLLSTVFDNIVL